ncbi:hypothetical protein [Nocardia brasiliensis]|nr:hypothetical protein [Nocardia brasiliensis]SUB40448.1 Uncharacterised protein [Nocardia brasiliensis]
MAVVRKRARVMAVVRVERFSAGSDVVVAVLLHAMGNVTVVRTPGYDKPALLVVVAVLMVAGALVNGLRRSLRDR